MSNKAAKRVRREQREAGIMTKHERRRAVYDAEQAAIARRKAEFEALPEEEKQAVRAHEARRWKRTRENLGTLLNTVAILNMPF